MQAQLAKVKESRARIVAAGDEQRRRIERDLHDGAQQRLVALALELKSAQRAETTTPELERLLGDAADEVQIAVEELRDLAGGIHPGILTQGGLAVALDALAAGATVPVTVDARLERVSPAIEATAYFVASEALTSERREARKCLDCVDRRDPRQRLARDRGRRQRRRRRIGGRRSGLRGLADRVEAQGGRFGSSALRASGTRVVGEIPCAS